MRELTVTVFVKPQDLITMFTVLKILDSIDINNDYVFHPSDIMYTEQFISNYTQINIPVDLYLKFTSKYLELSK